MLIGAMRMVPKPFRVHLLKGLLQQSQMAGTGSAVIQKQAQLSTRLGIQIEPPLVIILRATQSVKTNVEALE